MLSQAAPRSMGWPRFVAWMTLLLMAAVASAEATSYQFQIANVQDNLFFRYVETQGAPLRAASHVLPRLEQMLDAAQFSDQLLIPDRHVRLVDPRGADAGAYEPIAPEVDQPQHSDPWMTVSWEGTPGKTALFQIKGEQFHYQELIAVAVNTDGVLRRLPVSGIPLFGRHRQPAPSLSSTYLKYALERGTFVSLTQRYATSLHGLAVLVGRSDDLHDPDTVYLQVQMPHEARQYKVVLAWKDRDDLRKDNDNDGGVFD